MGFGNARAVTIRPVSEVIKEINCFGLGACGIALLKALPEVVDELIVRDVQAVLKARNKRMKHVRPREEPGVPGLPRVANVLGSEARHLLLDVLRHPREESTFRLLPENKLELTVVPVVGDEANAKVVPGNFLEDLCLRFGGLLGKGGHGPGVFGRHVGVLEHGPIEDGRIDVPEAEVDTVPVGGAVVKREPERRKSNQKQGKKRGSRRGKGGRGQKKVSERAYMQEHGHFEKD